MNIKGITVNAGRSVEGEKVYRQEDVGVRITETSVVFFDLESLDQLLCLKRSDFKLIHDHFLPLQSSGILIVG